MKWSVSESRKALKQKDKLPEEIQTLLVLLEKEIEVLGPVRGNWPNYSKLGKDLHHCHLRNGRPTYVACWEVTNKEIKLVEVYYVGTREKAPY
jgi:mRNA-degrading endonuclease RelE of RelBE toxin-antitoxin system